MAPTSRRQPCCRHAYHLMSVSVGTLTGLATVAGLAILLYRRVTVPAVRQATTTIDKVMYLLLSAAIGTEMLDTVGSAPSRPRR